MNEDIVADLKQFIVEVVTREATNIRQDFGQKLDQGLGSLRNEMNTLLQEVNEKIDNLSHAVAEALEASNEATEAQLQDHNRRITRLEHR